MGVHCNEHNSEPIKKKTVTGELLGYVLAQLLPHSHQLLLRKRSTLLTIPLCVVAHVNTRNFYTPILVYFVLENSIVHITFSDETLSRE